MGWLTLSGCALDERALEAAADKSPSSSVDVTHSSGNNSSSSGSSASNFTGSDASGSDNSADAGSRSEAPHENADERDAATSPSSAVRAGDEEAGAASGSLDAGRPGLRCSDLDDNGIGDCDETQLLNHGFDVDASQWDVDQGAELQWVADDSEARSGSGALQITNVLQKEGTASSFAGVRQCLSASPDKTYLLAARVKLDADLDAGSGGSNVVFFDDAHCAGSPLGIANAYTTRSEWSSPRVTVQAPPATASARVSLGVVKTFDAPPTTMWIDNVLFKLASE